MTELLKHPDFLEFAQAAEGAEQVAAGIVVGLGAAVQDGLVLLAVGTMLMKHQIRDGGGIPLEHRAAAVMASLLIEAVPPENWEAVAELLPEYFEKQKQAMLAFKKRDEGSDG